MLLCIEVVLRSCSELRDVEDASWIIASFLGPPPNMSLDEACSSGSVRLLDWIWVSSCTSIADRAPHWTLTNYLRSESHYYRYQFSKSLNVAAARGDLTVLKWLFAHFSGCVAPCIVVGAAVKKGHLAAVQLLWANCFQNQYSNKGHKKRKIIGDRGQTLAVRIHENPRKCAGAVNNVLWENRIVLHAAENGHFDMVRWLCENTDYEDDECYDKAIEHALTVSDDDLVKFMLSPGRCVLDHAINCPQVEVIELMLDCGYLRRDAKSAMRAIANLAGSGVWISCNKLHCFTLHLKKTAQIGRDGPIFGLIVGSKR